MREPRNRDNGASDVWALTAYYHHGFGPCGAYVYHSLLCFCSATLGKKFQRKYLVRHEQIFVCLQSGRKLTTAWEIHQDFSEARRENGTVFCQWHYPRSTCRASVPVWRCHGATRPGQCRASPCAIVHVPHNFGGVVLKVNLYTNFPFFFVYRDGDHFTTLEYYHPLSVWEARFLGFFESLEKIWCSLLWNKSILRSVWATKFAIVNLR